MGSHFGKALANPILVCGSRACQPVDPKSKTLKPEALNLAQGAATEEETQKKGFQIGNVFVQCLCSEAGFRDGLGLRGRGGGGGGGGGAQK